MLEYDFRTLSVNPRFASGMSLMLDSSWWIERDPDRPCLRDATPPASLGKLKLVKHGDEMAACAVAPPNEPMNRKGGFRLRSGLIAYVERRSAIGATLPLAVVPAMDGCPPPAAIRQPRREGPLWVKLGPRAASGSGPFIPE